MIQHMSGRIINEIIVSPTGIIRNELVEAFRTIEEYDVMVEQIVMHKHTLINCVRDWMHKEIEPCKKDETTEDNVFAYLWCAKLVTNNMLPINKIILISERFVDYNMIKENNSKIKRAIA